MTRFPLVLLVVIVSLSAVSAQRGGEHSFQFLELAGSPRVAAIGGSFLPQQDHDALLAMHHPALINEEMHGQIGFTFLDHYAGITGGNVAYSRTHEQFGSYLASIRFMHYGTFQRTDDAGMEQGTFTAADIALGLGWGRELHPGFRLGADLQMILSSYDVWSSFALGVNVSGHYTSESELFDAALLIRNAGRQLDRFGDVRESLPFDIAGGISRKLPHAPFRFYLLLNTLHMWDLTYHDPLNPRTTTDPITGEVKEPSKAVDFLDKAMRHVVGGVELAPGEVIRLRLGYNYRLRQEAGVQSTMGMVGFSWGVGLKLGRYQFDFSRTRNHMAGAPNFFSVTTNLNRFGS